MSFIDATYFVGELDIPNSGSPEVGQRITLFIQKYEQAFLLKLLGYSLFKAFMASLDGNTPPGSTDPRLQNIIEGVEYTDLNGDLQKWKGLMITTPQNDSILAYWVYYWFMRSTVTQTTAIGEVRNLAENSQLVSPRQKLISALNTVHFWAYEFLMFMKTNETNDPTLYPEWTFRNRIDAAKSFAFVNPIF